jgi:DNA-directed RNA polymerase subunit RPC12/RpoP
MTYHHKCSCGAEINYNTDIKQKTEYKCPFCNKKFNFQENDHERIKGSENSGQGK